MRCLYTLLVLLLLADVASAQDLFVSSRNTDSVKRFDGTTGAYLGDFVAPGSGGLGSTQAVAFGPDGHLYVSGRDNTAILKYDGESGAFLGEFTSGYTLDNPTKMTFGPDGLLYVSQWGTGQSAVAVFDAETGVFEFEVTPDLQLPMDHAWDEEGRLYVVVYAPTSVRRYEPDGFPIDVFIRASDLDQAVNLWFGDDGDLYVLEWFAGQVKRFDGETGDFIDIFLSGLTRAEGFAFTDDGDLLIADWEDNRIERFDAVTGEHKGTFTAEGGMLQPNSLVFGPKTDTSTQDSSEPSGALRVHPPVPNPASAHIELGFTLARPGHVSITVYDVLGRRVAQIGSDGVVEAGSQRRAVETTGWANGVYTYHMVVTRGSEVEWAGGRFVVAR